MKWWCYNCHPAAITRRIVHIQMRKRTLQFDTGRRQLDDHLIWFWIGPHDEYERLLRDL